MSKFFLKDHHSKQIGFLTTAPPLFTCSLSRFYVINKCDAFQTRHNGTHNLSLSLIDYYQQAGRAGRDGGNARCILLYNKSDYDLNRYVIEQNQEPRALDYSLKALDEMKEYADSAEGCIVQKMSATLGEQLNKPCGKCTCCQKARKP